MANHERGAYYKALKAAGVEFSKHFREYTLAELKEAYDALEQKGAVGPIELPPEKSEEEQMWREPEPQGEAVSRADFDALVNSMSQLTQAVGALITPAPADAPTVTTFENKAEVAKAAAAPTPTLAAEATVHESAGLEENEILFVDESGLEWYRREVRKAATPKPRGRRILKYIDKGAVEETIKDGKYVETFEVENREGQPRTAEVRVTLPTYQTGIYKDPRLPFKIHVYNDVRGFDLFDIWDYFGGETLVPEDCKRMYVSNDLCYDIRSVINYIEAEHRRLQLQGRL